MPLRLCYIVESGTDVRTVEGLAEYFDLTILARKIEDGVEISQAPSVSVRSKVGPASRFGFARFVWRHLLSRRDSYDAVMVQNYAMAALAANLVSCLTRTSTF